MDSNFLTSAVILLFAAIVSVPLSRRLDRFGKRVYCGDASRLELLAIDSSMTRRKSLPRPKITRANSKNFSRRIRPN